jgi:LPS-assembly protein
MPRLILRAALLLLAFASAATPALADTPLHWSGRRQVWDRKSNVVSLTGAATLVQPGEVLTADEMRIDLQQRTVRAIGHCVFISRDLIMQGQSMEFNIDTRNGTITGGRVSTEGFTLAGERISRLGQGRFQATGAEYTTCKDCPQSWSFSGDSVDLTLGGYARLSGVKGKVTDVPVTWFPYLIFPLKTSRQTGLLMPRFRLSGADGLVYVQSFFWAVSRSTDLTLALGSYSRRGARAEIEGRYRLAGSSEGQVNFFFQRDETYFPVRRSFAQRTITELGAVPSRWAFMLNQRQQLSPRWEQKLQIMETRDADYVSQVGDVPGGNDSVIGSLLSFTRTGDQSSIVVSGNRFRSRLGENPLKFDDSVVQPLPSLTLTTNERPLPYGFTGGMTLGFSRFSRGAGSFDPDILGDTPSPLLSGGPARPGVDPLRKASRLSLTPKLYSSLELIDGVSLMPSAEYRAIHYSFGEDSGVQTLSRGYLLTQMDVSAQWERLYGTSLKHFFRPRLTYSLIPSIQDSEGHPFVQQIQYAQVRGFSGYNFDNLDIIPRDTARSYNNYFLPLGNALTLGVTSQLVGKNGEGAYSRLVEFSAGQTVNFREYRFPSEVRQPFSRLASSLLIELSSFSSRVNYFYYPYARPDAPSNRNKVSANLAWSWQKGLRKRVLEFDRSISLGYQYDRLDGINRVKNVNGTVRFSLTDSILPYAGVDYHLRTEEGDPSKLQRANVGITFQSLSQCWRITMNLARTLERPGTAFDFDLGLNLAGEGFGQTPISVPR